MGLKKATMAFSALQWKEAEEDSLCVGWNEGGNSVDIIRLADVIYIYMNENILYLFIIL